MIFRGVLGVDEESLMEAGHTELVRNRRQQLFEVNKKRLLSEVQRTTDREILDVLYQSSPEHNLSIFSFIFSPED